MMTGIVGEDTDEKMGIEGEDSTGAPHSGERTNLFGSCQRRPPSMLKQLKNCCKTLNLLSEG